MVGGTGKAKSLTLPRSDDLCIAAGGVPGSNDSPCAAIRWRRWIPKNPGFPKNCKIHGTGMFIPTLSNKNSTKCRWRHVDISPCCFVPFLPHPPVAGVHTWYAMDGFCTCDAVRATEWTASVQSVPLGQ